jgi:hypothetical protein
MQKLVSRRDAAKWGAIVGLGVLGASTTTVADEPVPDADKNLKADDKRFAFVGRLEGRSGEVSKKTDTTRATIPVTVQNASNHNCTGGTISAKNTASGEIKSTNFGPIAIGRQQTNYIYMDTGYPDFIGWYFTAEGGGAWGPGSAYIPGGTSSITCPLQPF